MWDSIDDIQKRREIRYGNNIYVLFRALLHLRRFWGQDSLWSAVAKGFNTSGSVVRATAEALTEARRAQRVKKSRDVSDTARAADEWIDFVDSQPKGLRVLSDPEVYKVAEAFFKEQEKKHLNAARVPTDPRRSQAHLAAQYIQAAQMKEDEEVSPPLSPRLFSPLLPPEPMSTVKQEQREEVKGVNPPRGPRKRAASPALLLERSPKQRKFSMDERAPPTGPAAERQRPVPQSYRPQYDAEPRRASRQEDSGHVETSASRKSYSSSEDIILLKARIASLEKELAEAKEKANSQPHSHANATQAQQPASQAVVVATKPLDETVSSLQSDMATVTNVVGTMMESMHVIVDSLNLLRDDITGLSGQQKELASAVAGVTSAATKEGSVAAITNGVSDGREIEKLLGPIQTLVEGLATLRQEVAELKKQPPSQQPPSGSTATLEALLHQQTAHIAKLSTQVNALQSRMQAQQALFTTPPQTLRQAFALAQLDLKKHKTVIEGFYSSMGHNASRHTMEQTANLLGAIQHGLGVIRESGLVGYGQGREAD